MTPDAAPGAPNPDQEVELPPAFAIPVNRAGALYNAVTAAKRAGAYDAENWTQLYLLADTMLWLEMQIQRQTQDKDAT